MIVCSWCVPNLRKSWRVQCFGIFAQKLDVLRNHLAVLRAPVWNSLLPSWAQVGQDCHGATDSMTNSIRRGFVKGSEFMNTPYLRWWYNFFFKSTAIMIKVLEQCSLGLAIHTQDHLKMVEHCQFSMQIHWILMVSNYDSVIKDGDYLQIFLPNKSNRN